MIAQPNPWPTPNARQEGFVLIVGLVILGLLTMLALSSMRDTTLQDKMAGASRDSGLAFQAAESALRDAENCISGTTDNCAFDEFTHDAHFGQNDAAFPEHNALFDANTWVAIDPPGAATVLTGVPPGGVKYIIRQAGTVSGAGSGEGGDVSTGDYSKSTEKSSGVIYEITARGAGTSGAGQSVLRVYYRQ